jgi:hypothetical protein
MLKKIDNYSCYGTKECIAKIIEYMEDEEELITSAFTFNMLDNIDELDELNDEYIYETISAVNKILSRGICPKKKDCLTAIARVMNKCGWELQIITNPRTSFSTVVALKR